MYGNIPEPLACETTFLIDIGLLSNCRACCDQLIKILITVEPYGICRSKFAYLSILILSSYWYAKRRRWFAEHHFGRSRSCKPNELRVRLAHHETGLSPPVKYFTDCSKAVLLLWIFYVFSVLRLLCLCARLFIYALWSPAGKGLTSWLSFVVSNCEFVTVPLVSWVRCGT